MGLPKYTEFYSNFDAAALEAEVLDGRLDSGLNVCHEICDKWAVDIQASPLFHFDGYTWGEKDPFVNGYYLTGDMVTCHGDGSFSFSGRDDDIITTAGYRVGPADVESTLLEHAAVAESGVVAKPDEKRGSVIKAYVVIKAGQEPADDSALKEELQELVRRRLSTHAFPREIEFVDELPKTPSGKIQRFVLRNRAKEEADV